MAAQCHDARFQSLLNLVPQVNEWYTQKNRQPPFKVVIVVGDQSSGKSAVVQRFVGFPVNITKKETGTRRPLKIILRHSAEHRQPKCVLDGHEMDRSQVLKEVWRVNNELAKQNNFEFKPLVLEVTSAEVISITLIDLPGLKYTQEKSDTSHACSSDHRQRIRDIIRENITGQRYQLLVTLDAAELTKNQVINFLDEAFHCNAHSRSKWVEKALFCMSKADKLLNDKNYQQRDALKDLLDNYHQHGIRPCLVYNDPSGLEDALQRSVEDDSHDFLKQFDAMSRHIAALDESEAELWKRYTDSLALKDIREDLVEKRTFRHLKDEMYQGYRCDVEHQFHEVQDEIQQDVCKLKEELQALKRQDRKELRVQSALACHDAALKGVRAFIDGPPLEMQEEHEQQKTTLKEEVDDACTKSAFEDFPRNPKDYLDCIANEKVEQSQHYRPEDPLLGGQQLTRKFCFILDVLVQKFRDPTEISDNDVRNAMGGEVNGRPARDRAFLFLVRRCVTRELELTLDWYVNALGLHFKKYWDLSAEKHIRDTKTRKFLTDIFHQRLRRFIQEAREQLSFNLEPKLCQLRLSHEPDLGPLMEGIKNLEPLERKKKFGQEMTRLRCTARSSDEPSCLQPCDDRIKAVKDEASLYLLGIIHEIVKELTWDLRYMNKKFKDSLEQSDFTGPTKDAQEAFQALNDFAERTNLKEKIRKMEVDLEVLEAGCLAELKKYFEGTGKPAPTQSAKMAGA
ncbi:Dynamin-related protein 5A [Symbiodinium microadriaticum]|uniref:Dynamin-related protein 5A n=1 Tax=Symbiodinium microadriaticum TaxID=2951 RepID=A0A1Q9C3F6_SYMMI|nr:Dynamin-related protein 5A [Symbiodinium microadriaticum]